MPSPPPSNIPKDWIFEAPETKVERPTCGFCLDSAAILHCRADDALLCLACDRHVHSANTVSSKHPRSLLCDFCLLSPASSFCCTHRLLLCSNCDFDSHRFPSRGGHVKRPVEPFSGCPGAVELMSLLGIEGDEKRLSEEEDEEEVWVWEEVLNLDQLVVPVEAGDGLQAVGVPPPPKDRNSSCGKYKEEILKQLRGLFKSELDAGNHLWHQEQDQEFEQSSRLENKDIIIRGAHEAPYCLSNEGDFLVWQGNSCEQPGAFSITYDQLLLQTTAENYQFVQHDKDGNEVLDENRVNVNETEGIHLITANAAPSIPLTAVIELSGADRESAILRYREKRKTRRYEKRVIYESRRDRAKSRIRIKGRFAKINMGS